MGNDANKLDTSSATPSVALRNRLRRWSGYAFWSVAAFALPIGLDRLVVCPILKRHLGEEVFGGFIWLLGIVNLIGLSTGAGFGNFLMRDLSRHAADQARAMMRTTLLTTTAVGLAIMAIGGYASYLTAGKVVQEHAASLYIPLGAFAVVRCVQWILITNLRIKRLFATVFVLKVVEATILLVILLAAPSRNLWIIGGIYVASVLTPLLTAGHLCRSDIGTGRWWDRGLARTIMVAWGGLAMSGLIEQSLVYAPRIVLGIMQDDLASVTILFQGTSVGNVFVTPVGLGGGVVLSLLARRTDFALAGRIGVYYLLTSLGLAAAVGLASFFLGRVLLRFLYPGSAEATLEFYHWIAIATACTSVIVLMRPVAMKYVRVRSLVYLSTGTLTLQLAALIVLVPALGAHGAAIALAFSSALAMVLWCGCYIRLLRSGAGGREPDANEPGNTPTT